MKLSLQTRGLTLVEMMVTLLLVSVPRSSYLFDPVY